MAMSNCEECGQAVSTLADACPSCGAPLPTAAAKRGWWLRALVVVVIVAGGMIWYLNSVESTQDQLDKIERDTTRNVECAQENIRRALDGLSALPCT